MRQFLLTYKTYFHTHMPGLVSFPVMYPGQGEEMWGGGGSDGDERRERGMDASLPTAALLLSSSSLQATFSGMRLSSPDTVAGRFLGACFFPRQKRQQRTLRLQGKWAHGHINVFTIADYNFRKITALEFLQSSLLSWHGVWHSVYSRATRHRQPRQRQTLR